MSASAPSSSSSWSGAALASPRLGAVLAGTYRLDRVIGAGAMASVFAATHLRNANRVAVKVLHPAMQINADVRARFLREGYAANSVRHAGTVRALDDGTTDDGAAFIVMELLEGETLEAFWERRGRRLPPVEVARLMGQLLDVLAAAHANGIVHRDIKPENLFLERDGTLRVLDFGVARVLEGAITETRAGSIIGTLPYMAPEQTLGKSHEVDARSDLWSVGATAFTLVSGSFVHDAETPEEMMVLTGSRQPRSLAAVAPEVPADFVRVVDRALRFQKVHRWPSAVAMQAAFAETCSSSRRGQPLTLPAASSRVEDVPPSPPTLVSSGEVALVRPPMQRYPRWRTAALAAALASALLTLAIHGRYSAQPTQTLAIAPSPVPIASPPVMSPNPMGITAPMPDSPSVADILSSTVATTAAQGRSEAGPDALKALGSRATPPIVKAEFQSDSRTERGAAGARSSTPPSSDCAPPYTILPITGKKRWKRECL